MQIEQIVEFIIKNPHAYPGTHLFPAERTSDAFKPLEPKSQMLVIWRALCEYLKENIQMYKGVYIKNFGTFTYEVKTTLPRLGIDINQSKYKPFSQLLLEKKVQHILRPCFVIDTKFKPILPRFLDKEELTKPKSQSSIYQKGFQMIFCNPTPISAGCFMNRKTVEDAINAITKATYDLVSFGKNVVLKTGFCNICFIDKNLTYSFSGEINSMVKDLKTKEETLKRGITPVQKTWRTTALSRWGKSTLSSMLERPQTPLIKTIDNKNQLLKIMSLDLCSTYSNGINK